MLRIEEWRVIVTSSVSAKRVWSQRSRSYPGPEANTLPLVLSFRPVQLLAKTLKGGIVSALPSRDPPHAHEMELNSFLPAGYMLINLDFRFDPRIPMSRLHRGKVQEMQEMKLQTVSGALGLLACFSSCFMA